MTRYDEFLEMQSQETDDCILWPYQKNNVGYGLVWHSGRKHVVSRLSCLTTHGPHPTDQKYDAAHSCHTPLCMNPRHLRWTTRKENAADRVADGTENSGVRNGTAKLKEFDVLAIRHYAKCGTKHRVLAEHYGVATSLISLITTRKNWRHI